MMKIASRNSKHAEIKAETFQGFLSAMAVQAVSVKIQLPDSAQLPTLIASDVRRVVEGRMGQPRQELFNEN